MEKFYLTTPIYYPSARLHAGHAYTTLLCDALARYKRQCGYDVAFLTGTDEHGEKLERAAIAAGMTPQAFVAEKREQIKALWKLLDIDYTHFIYTDRPDHTISVQRMLKRAEQAGHIYKGHYEGRYCIHCELYIADGAEPADCPVCGRPGELISEGNYFFKLSAFQDWLLQYYEEHPDFVQPDFRRNEVTSFVKGGLRDISVSRKRIKWGVPWPGDPEQVFYVWYDALTSYLTGVGYGQADDGNEEFRRYWPADVHMIGKDIIRFHAVYWPAFLKAAGVPLPKSVVVHGWLLVGQDKMSKSRGNAVYVEPVVELFRSETKGVVSGADVLRYYVLRDVLFGQDGNITYASLLQRYNSDLANDLGNLASRTVTMLHRYFGGQVPDWKAGWTEREETQMKARAGNALEEFRTLFERYDFSRALDRVWELVAEVNKYLVVAQPWALAESSAQQDRARLGSILYAAAESLRVLSVILQAVMPRSAQRLWKQLGQQGELENQPLDELEWGELKPGTKVGKPEIIFPRLDKVAALEKLLKLEAAEQGPSVPAKEGGSQVASKPEPVAPGLTPAEPKASEVPQAPNPAPPAPGTQSPAPTISIEDFAKVDMRVGEVLAAEPIPGAKKLLKLMVDIGTEVRQVCAGIAEYYQPEQLVGMKVVLVANLEPRKLRGVESNGMIVAASVGGEGKPVLATFKEDVPKGAKLK